MKSFPDSPEQILYTYRAEEAFIPVLDMDLVAGRNFSLDYTEDAAQGVIVNEAFVQALTLYNSVGMTLPVALAEIGQPLNVGVVKDFHFQSLRSNPVDALR
jgi:putative ABC transport system permease protein